MKRFKIVRTDRELEMPQLDQALRDRGATLVLLPEEISETELEAETNNADLILTCYTPISARLIERATRLKGIVKYGVGIDAINIDAAKARSIPVVNIPGYAEETVAEGAFALMIALMRKLKPLMNTMQSDGWVWPTARWMGSDLAGKTLGLVGAGRIGRNMARMSGAGFRMRVLGFDPHTDAQTMAAAGIEKVDELRDMLMQCDVVSIHTILNSQTRRLIGADELAAMKHYALLINVSRGAIVDEAALVDALRQGTIAGAGLDVYGIEPLDRKQHPMSPLFAMDNVILLPHLTFYTQEAMQRLQDETMERCLEILSGGPVVVKSRDPRLTSQRNGVTFAE